MKIGFYGDSLTLGYPGVSYFKLLQRRLPEDTLLNFGHFNDTAISLHRRIITHRLLHHLDVTFLWVGINDVIVRQSALFSRLRRWWARDDGEFRVHYRALLDLLTPHTGLVITVSPALLGETRGSPANRALESVGNIIDELTQGYPNGQFLDIHSVYASQLAGAAHAEYRPHHPLQSVLDTLTLRTSEAVDRVSSERGLRLTLDNVHLNSAGALLAAEEFARTIACLKYGSSASAAQK